MTGEDDEQPGAGACDGKAPSHLRVVSGPPAAAADSESMPAVRLRREFKGLTVADLHREEIARRLPGQVRSALNHIEAGDLGSAERALPGHFQNVLAGPGHRRRDRWPAFAILSVLAVVTGSLIASWLTT